ncbi:MAG: phosphoribosylglycinamide formyltransferase [Candidatus Omnitrophota bacterium]
MNIAVFASGRGSNFEAIAKAVRSGKIKANLALMLSDNPSAPVIFKAKRLKVKTALIDPRLYPTKKSLEDRIIRHLKDNRIELILLAGFMRILSPRLVLAYKNKIINIHPSLLPAFKGAQAIKDAFNYGVKVTGVTVHFVDEKMDHGPIILQREVKIKEAESLASLEKKIHKLEHKIYPEAVRLFINKKLKIRDRKVLIVNR